MAAEKQAVVGCVKTDVQNNIATIEFYRPQSDSPQGCYLTFNLQAFSPSFLRRQESPKFIPAG